MGVRKRERKNEIRKWNDWKSKKQEWEYEREKEITR